MIRPSMGNIAILSPDWRTWAEDEGMENDLLTFENSIMDGFTSFLNYTIVDIYHMILGRHIHVSSLEIRSLPSSDSSYKTGSKG